MTHLRWTLTLALITVLFAGCSSEEDDFPPFAGYPGEEEARYEKLVAGPDWSRADPPRNARGLLEAVHRKSGITFVLLPGGTFEMGTPEDGAVDDLKLEVPRHPVTVQPFLISRTEVTNAQYEKPLTEHERPRGPPEDDRPAVDVSWGEAHRFCAWCADGGGEVRLPTEAEWEYACRAGSTTTWCSGDDEEKLLEFAWVNVNTPGVAREVATRKPNAWGLFDMHGNAMEWCEDTFHESYVGAPVDGSAWVEGSPWGTDFRMVRGGGCLLDTRSCRSANRIWCAAERSRNSMGYEHLGFRLVADLPR